MHFILFIFFHLIFGHVYHFGSAATQQHADAITLWHLNGEIWEKCDKKGGAKSQYLSESLPLLGAIRPIKPSRAAVVPGDFTADEGTDWLGMLWSLAASLVAPDDDEEEGIHQLTETLTCKKTFHSLVLTARQRPICNQFANYDHYLDILFWPCFPQTSVSDWQWDFVYLTHEWANIFWELQIHSSRVVLCECSPYCADNINDRAVGMWLLTTQCATKSP